MKQLALLAFTGLFLTACHKEKQTPAYQSIGLQTGTKYTLRVFTDTVAIDTFTINSPTSITESMKGKEYTYTVSMRYGTEWGRDALVIYSNIQQFAGQFMPTFPTLWSAAKDSVIIYKQAQYWEYYEGSTYKIQPL